MENTINKLKNYLYNLYLHKDMTKTELYNFCQEFMRFVFEKNGLNVGDYNIELVFLNGNASESLPEATFDLQNGEMKYQVKLEYVPFYTNLTQKVLKSKTHKKFSKYGKEKYRSKMVDYQDSRLDAIFRILTDAGHEFHHLVQFILRIEDEYAYQDAQSDIESLIFTDYSTSLTKRESQTFKRSLANYSFCLETLSDFEVEADINSDIYCRSMITDVKTIASEPNFCEFLNLTYNKFKKLDKERFKYLNLRSFSLRKSESLINRYLDKINLTNALNTMKARKNKSAPNLIECDLVEPTELIDD